MEMRPTISDDFFCVLSVAPAESVALRGGDGTKLPLVALAVPRRTGCPGPVWAFILGKGWLPWDQVDPTPEAPPSVPDATGDASSLATQHYIDHLFGVSNE